MSGALRGKPKEPFSKLVPLGAPAFDDADASATEDPNSDENCESGKKHKHRHDGCNGDDSDDSDNSDDGDECDFVECDEDGKPTRGKRNSDDTNNSFGNDDGN